MSSDCPYVFKYHPFSHRPTTLPRCQLVSLYGPLNQPTEWSFPLLTISVSCRYEGHHTVLRRSVASHIILKDDVAQHINQFMSSSKSTVA